MKYLKKKQKKRGPFIIGLVLMLAAAVIALLSANNGNKTIQTETVPTVAETTPPTETEPMWVLQDVTEPIPVLELKNGEIHTPYGVLNYPEELSDHLLIANTSTEPYTLEFYATMKDKKEVRLFDISFGKESGGNMGMVNTTLGEVPLNVTIYTFTQDENWTEDEIITLQAMQDMINELLEQLVPQNSDAHSEDPEIVEQPAQGSEVNNLEIETPMCTLYYPARWGNSLRYDYDDSQEDVYKVRFYGKVGNQEVQLLFSIYFGGDEGEQLGAVLSPEGTPIPVNLVMGQLQLDGLNEEEVVLLCAMQEASNQLIERLPLLQ